MYTYRCIYIYIYHHIIICLCMYIYIYICTITSTSKIPQIAAPVALQSLPGANRTVPDDVAGHLGKASPCIAQLSNTYLFMGL